MRHTRPEEKVTRKIDMNHYIDGQKINYGRLITDEVLAVDSSLVDAAKKNMDVAGMNSKQQRNSRFGNIDENMC